MFLFFFVLLNIFLAIILDAWNAEAEVERRSTSNVDLWEETLQAVRAWWEVFRRRYRERRYWTTQLRKVSNLLLCVPVPAWRGSGSAVGAHPAPPLPWPGRRRNKETRGFLSDEVVLAKLQEWKRKRQNRSAKHMTITHVQQCVGHGARVPPARM